MTKITLYSTDPKRLVREMVSLALQEAGNFVAETKSRGAKQSISAKDMLATDMLARMLTGKPLSQMEDYI